MPREYCVEAFRKLNGGIIHTSGGFNMPVPNLSYFRDPSGESRWKNSKVIRCLAIIFYSIWFFSLICAVWMDIFLLKIFKFLGWMDLIYKSRFKISGKVIKRPKHFSTEIERAIFEGVCSEFEYNNFQEQFFLEFTGARLEYKNRKCLDEYDKVLCDVMNFLVQEGVVVERYRLIVRVRVGLQLEHPTVVNWDKNGKLLKDGSPILTVDQKKLLIASEYAEYFNSAKKIIINECNFKKVWIKKDYAEAEKI